MVPGVKPLDRAEIHGVAKPPVERIAPSVVAAGEGLSAVARPIRHQRSGPMPANVVKGGEGAIGLAHDNHRGAADHIGKIVAGRRDLAVMAHELPGTAQHVFPVAPQSVFAAIEVNRQHGLLRRKSRLNLAAAEPKIQQGSCAQGNPAAPHSGPRNA